ncbi:hypothetical protein [Dactylosporangium sp. CA-092794]|uniref:hypothetical protein n=1 Tax=Dactylosporangium sp. CA-092794 TaxID=3239929 RepID=UPI003D94B95E
MARWKRRKDNAADADRDAAPWAGNARAAPGPDKFATRETAAGVFRRPPAPQHPRPEPPPRPAAPPADPALPDPAPSVGLDEARRLSVRPLRTPAPAVTTIRVEAVPVDGFEYETAVPWHSEAAQDTAPPPAGPPPVVPRPRPGPPSRVRFAPLGPKPEPPTISWLDE